MKQKEEEKSDIPPIGQAFVESFYRICAEESDPEERLKKLISEHERACEQAGLLLPGKEENQHDRKSTALDEPLYFREGGLTTY